MRDRNLQADVDGLRTALIGDLNTGAPDLARGREADRDHASAIAAHAHGRVDAEPSRGFKISARRMIDETVTRWVHERARLRALTCPKAAAREVAHA